MTTSKSQYYEQFKRFQISRSYYQNVANKNTSRYFNQDSRYFFFQIKQCLSKQHAETKRSTVTNENYYQIEKLENRIKRTRF